jgi:Gram-negative bacterial TonB protein C-terminal
MRLPVIAFLFALSLVSIGKGDDISDCAPSYIVAPQYPTLAFQARYGGQVAIEVQVSAVGAVEAVSRFEGDRLFRAASENAARLWRYASSARTSRRCTMTLTYKIMPKGARPEDVTPRFEPPAHVEVRRETAEPSVTVDPAPDHRDEERKSAAPARSKGE